MEGRKVGPQIFLAVEEGIKSRDENKEAFKSALRVLFEQGKTPETITNENLGNILGIEVVSVVSKTLEQKTIIAQRLDTPTKNATEEDLDKILTKKLASNLSGRITNTLKRMFISSMNKREILEFQYQLYLEDKEAQK